MIFTRECNRTNTYIQSNRQRQPRTIVHNYMINTPTNKWRAEKKTHHKCSHSSIMTESWLSVIVLHFTRPEHISRNKMNCENCRYLHISMAVWFVRFLCVCVCVCMLIYVREAGKVPDRSRAEKEKKQIIWNSSEWSQLNMIHKSQTQNFHGMENKVGKPRASSVLFYYQNPYRPLNIIYLIKMSIYINIIRCDNCLRLCECGNILSVQCKYPNRLQNSWNTAANKQPQNCSPFNQANTKTTAEN